MEHARSITRMMYNAPMALLVCYDSVVSWKATVQSFGEDYEGSELDAAIVTTSMMMQATELGVDTLWVRDFSAGRVADVFQLPEHIHPVCFLLLGYPAENTLRGSKNHTVRKELQETVIEL